jgi:lysozyme
VRWIQALFALLVYVWGMFGAFMVAFTLTHGAAEGGVRVKISAAGIAHIKHFEGCRLSSYFCTSGVCTIGFGHTGPDVKPGMTISEERAEELLRRDLEAAEKAVADLVTVPLRQGQHDALVDFAFNLGRDALAGSTLLKLLNQRRYGKAAEQLMRWVHSGSAVIAGLQRRRQAARRMWLEQA